MREIKQAFKEIFATYRPLFWAMLLLLVGGLALTVYSCLSLSPGSALVTSGYSDITGYRYGSWSDLLAFALLGLLFGLCHNLLAARLFANNRKSWAMVFVILSLLLVLFGFVTLNRLLGEG